MRVIERRLAIKLAKTSSQKHRLEKYAKMAGSAAAALLANRYGRFTPSWRAVTTESKFKFGSRRGPYTRLAELPSGPGPPHTAPPGPGPQLRPVTQSGSGLQTSARSARASESCTWCWPLAGQCPTCGTVKRPRGPDWRSARRPPLRARSESCSRWATEPGQYPACGPRYGLAALTLR